MTGQFSVPNPNNSRKFLEDDRCQTADKSFSSCDFGDKLKPSIFAKKAHQYVEKREQTSDSSYLPPEFSHNFGSKQNDQFYEDSSEEHSGFSLIRSFYSYKSVKEDQSFSKESIDEGSKIFSEGHQPGSSIQPVKSKQFRTLSQLKSPGSFPRNLLHSPASEPAGHLCKQARRELLGPKSSNSSFPHHLQPKGDF